jgi:hypothetical protein
MAKSENGAALFTFALLLTGCYISLRLNYAIRVAQYMRVEQYVLREVNDVELGIAGRTRVDEPKRKKVGASQEEIDRSLCSYAMKSYPRQFVETGGDFESQGVEEVLKKELSCLVCGEKRTITVSETDSCSICLADVEDNETEISIQNGIRVLPCGHGTSNSSPFRYGETEYGYLLRII